MGVLELTLKQTDLKTLEILLDPLVSLPDVLQPPEELVIALVPRGRGYGHPQVLIHLCRLLPPLSNRR